MEKLLSLQAVYRINVFFKEKTQLLLHKHIKGPYKCKLIFKKKIGKENK